MSGDLQELLLQLQLNRHRLDCLAKDAQRDEKIQQTRMTKAIQQGKMEEALIYAENSVRRKNEAEEYFHMSSRISTVCIKFQKAIEMVKVSRNMTSFVNTLGSAVNSTDFQRVSNAMERFDRMFQELDEANTSVVPDAIRSVTTKPTLYSQVHSLIAQAVEDNRHNMKDQLAAAQFIQSSSISAAAAQSTPSVSISAAAAAADISHAEEDAPSCSLLQSQPVSTDSVVDIIQNMTPHQRTEVLNIIRALETRDSD